MLLPPILNLELDLPTAIPSLLSGFLENSCRLEDWDGVSLGLTVFRWLRQRQA